MMLKRFAFLLVALALVAGCNNEKTRSLIDRRSDQAIKMSEEAQAPAAKKSYDPLTVTDKVWAGDVSTRLRRGRPLPDRYEGARGVALISGDPMSLAEIATAIGAQTGIPVRVASDATRTPLVPAAIPGAKAPAIPAADSSSGDGMSIAYEGPLSGLLDLVAGHFGVSWRYDGGSINFSRFETRVFVVESLPGTQKTKDGIRDSDNNTGDSSSSAEAGGSFSVSSSGSLSQSSEMTSEMKIWDELSASITSMLGGVGTVVVSPSSGTVSVTTTPELMRTVARFMEEENKRLSQQIAVNVEIYAVSLSEGTDFSVTFNEALRRLTNFGAAYASPSGVTGIVSPQFGSGNIATGAADGSMTGLATGIVSSSGAATGAVSGGGNLAVAILNPKTVGQISFLFSALSTIGDTTRVAQFPLTTLNNRTVSRRIGRDRTYVASVSNTNSTSSSYSSSTVTPGTVREGFSLQLTPRLLDDGRIMLQYSMSLIDIVSLTSFDTGAGTIQLPETSSRVFVQQAMLKSGSTLIIGGYDDEQASQSSQGVGSPFNYFLGGGSSNSKTRTMLFIAITPQVLDPRRAEQG